LINLKSILLFCSVIVLCACKKPENDWVAEKATFLLPTYINTPQNMQNIPKDGVLLGERLFNDPLLSGNGTVSCASCHLKENAFAEPVKLSTKGANQTSLKRHTPTLFNLAWHNDFFWDGGAPDLNSQALAPLTSPNEMDSDLKSILSYLNSNLVYQKLFKNSFESGEINSLNLLQALSWYQLSLLSFGSKYDLFLTKNDSSLLNASEKRGLKIYEKNCNSCHTLPLASNYGYAKNELDSIFDFPFEDERLGRNRITNKQEDLGKYKIPSLRNIGFSAPYMHDGRLENLDAVLTHYQNTKKLNISFSDLDKEYLKSFLLALNDEKFIQK
jgi:cytochrome c peroxidase